jgi:hypothetical protein
MDAQRNGAFTDFCTEICPHCGKANVIPGFSEMMACTCQKSGELVRLSDARYIDRFFGPADDDLTREIRGSSNQTQVVRYETAASGDTALPHYACQESAIATALTPCSDLGSSFRKGV